MHDFKLFPERFSGGSMTYAGAHPADADAVVFCYSSGAVSGTPRPDQLAGQWLDAAEKYGVSDGLCVFAIDFPIDEVPRDHGVSVADVVSDAVRAVARHNSTAARSLLRRFAQPSPRGRPIRRSRPIPDRSQHCRVARHRCVAAATLEDCRRYRSGQLSSARSTRAGGRRPDNRWLRQALRV